jgi:hypothetical protein
MSIRQLANGARLPNWVYLVGLGVLLGMQASGIVLGAKAGLSQLRDDHRAESQQVLATVNRVAERDSINYASLRATLDRRTNQINAELREISQKTGYIARQVE